MSTSVKAAKAMARHLADALKLAGQELPHSNLLEVVAKSLGARNWHAFQASANQAVVLPAAPATPQDDTPWNRHFGPQSTAQFLKSGGGCCPVCGDEDLSGESFDLDGDQCSQNVSCSNCNSSWSETYTRSSYLLTDEATKMSEHLFLEAVHAWLVEGCGEEAQYELDDVIVNWFSNRAMPAMNATDDEGSQEHALSSAELQASDINNQGIRGQLDFLWDELRTRKALIEYLAPTMGLDIDKLQFLTESND